MTPRAADLVAELSRVTAVAARANVTIYTFDPRGLDLHMGAELLATGVSPSTQLQQKRRCPPRCCAARRRRPAAPPPSRPTISAAPSGASPARAATTTCSATRPPTRRTTALPVDRRAREAAGPAGQRAQGLRRPRRSRVAATQLLRPGPGAVRAGATADVDPRPSARGDGGAAAGRVRQRHRHCRSRSRGAGLRRARWPAREHRRPGHRAGRHRRQVYPLVNGHARLSLPPEDADAVRAHGLRMVER